MDIKPDAKSTPEVTKKFVTMAAYFQQLIADFKCASISALL
jgi:hypothetical protein